MLLKKLFGKIDFASISTVLTWYFRCTSPGAFYECRESERLQKYCDDHQKLLSNEVDHYQSVLQKKSRLAKQLNELKQSQLERPRQLQPVLDAKYFLTN